MGAVDVVFEDAGVSSTLALRRGPFELPPQQRRWPYASVREVRFGPNLQHQRPQNAGAVNTFCIIYYFKNSRAFWYC